MGLGGQTSIGEAAIAGPFGCGGGTTWELDTGAGGTGAGALAGLGGQTSIGEAAIAGPFGCGGGTTWELDTGAGTLAGIGWQTSIGEACGGVAGETSISAAGAGA